MGDMNIWNTTGGTVLGLKKTDGSYILNPSSSQAVSQGDRIIIMGSQTQLNELYNLL